MAYKPFKMKGSPAKFIGMGLGKMIRDKARGTRVGNFMEKAAQSGMLGMGGAMLSGGEQNSQGIGEAQNIGGSAVPPHTHEDETAMVKKGEPYTPYKMKGSPMRRNFGVVAKGKKQVYKKEIKQLEDKISKTTNDAEISKLQKRVNDIRDKMAGHKIGDRPTPGEQKGFKGFKSR